MSTVATAIYRTRAAVGLGHGIPNVAAGVPPEAANRIARVRARRATESSVAAGYATDWNAAAAAAEDVRAGLRPAEVATSAELADLLERVRIASDKSAEAENAARAVATLAKAVEPIAAGKRTVRPAPRAEPYGADEFEAARERLATLNQERGEVERAPIGVAEAKEAARRQIDALAAEGPPERGRDGHHRQSVRHSGEVARPQRERRSTVHAGRRGASCVGLP